MYSSLSHLARLVELSTVLANAQPDVESRGSGPAGGGGAGGGRVCTQLGRLQAGGRSTHTVLYTARHKNTQAVIECSKTV
jgi:hypothetical protein